LQCDFRGNRKASERTAALKGKPRKVVKMAQISGPAFCGPSSASLS